MEIYRIEHKRKKCKKTLSEAIQKTIYPTHPSEIHLKQPPLFQYVKEKFIYSKLDVASLVYKNDQSQVHNEDGPAVIFINNVQNTLEESYYLFDKHVPANEFEDQCQSLKQKRIILEMIKKG